MYTTYIYTTRVFTVNMLTMGRGWCPREEVDQVGLGCLLKSSHGEALEKQVCLLGDCVNQTLKRKLPDEEVGACLAAWDLTEGYGTRTATVMLLDRQDKPHRDYA